ncbi:g5237 [Coccomyxa viridis]|uniref:G5237 protein n=1 Tax=Coccomyxa viridis TaxID=1274662 RepID=A0ABP1FXF3_9CHLO
MCIALTSSCNAAWVYGTSVKTSPYVGLSGNLSDVAHLMKDQTVGMLTIVSDNAFEVTNWTYTGMAPSVHWVTAASTSPADLEKYMLLNPDRVTMNYTMADVIVPVSSNVSWANTPIIALYCTQYKALFGSVNLKQELSMKMSSMPMAPSMSMGAVTTGGRKMI